MKRTLSMLGAVLALVAVMALGLPAQPAGAARPSKLPDLQCGVPITTSVKLSADLTCSTPVFVADHAPAVTIDLGGHTLRVDPVPDCTGRLSAIPTCTFTDHSGSATIANGTVDGSVGTRVGYGTTVTNVHVTGIATTGLYGGLTFSHDVIDGGIAQYAYGSIHDSVISGGIAISDDDAGTNIDIVNDRISGGVRISDGFDFDFVGGVISGNRIEGSGGDGISISGGGTNQMSRLDITGNTIVGNVGDGISYAQYSYYPPRYGDNGPITLENNIVRNNGGHGINLLETTHQGAATGVIDGGGNRANGNALDPQCIGVRCGPPDHRLVPDIVWHNAAMITSETPLGPDQLNATSSVPGTFTYAPAAGTLLPVGPWSLTVHFVPDDLVHYQPTDRAVSVFVQAPVRVPTTLTWAAPAAVSYGIPLGPDQLSATASTPGTFTYSPAAGTVLPVGLHQLSVSFVPDDPVHHASATATVTLEVLPPPDQTLTWAAPSAIIFGTALGPDQLDAVSSVPGTLTYDPPSGTVLKLGAHQLTVAFTPDDPVHYSAMTSTVTLVVLPAPGMITFEPPAEVLRGLVDIPTDVDLADFDGDGHLDVVTAAPSFFSTPGYLSVNLGRGDGSFVAPGRVIELGDGGHAVAVGDVNGDQHPDLVASNGSTRTISVLLGNGDGTFAPKVDIAAGAGQGDIQLADLDGDGNLDVVESNFTSGSVTVLLGDGHGGFGPKADYAVGGAPMKLAIADLDGDGALDVSVANYLSDSVSVLDGIGDGRLAVRRDLTVGDGPTGVVAIDLDHDGALDLVTADDLGGTLSIRRGDGAGGFLAATTVDAGQGGVHALTVGDVDGDGEPDLIATNVAGWVSVWKGTRTSVPGPRVDVPTGPEPRALAVGDLDGDHRLDLAVGRPYAFRLTVLLNRTPPLTQ